MLIIPDKLIIQGCKDILKREENNGIWKNGIIPESFYKIKHLMKLHKISSWQRIVESTINLGAIVIVAKNF